MTYECIMVGQIKIMNNVKA